MNTVSLVLILLLAVVVSAAVARMLPAAIPRPLVQIALGAAIGLATDYRAVLHPDVFFLLFLPPLLFLDGWRMPREDLFRDRSAILGLAFGLVFFTVLGAGVFIHWLIPAMPQAVAFALAAVLSPTDATAVSAILRRMPLSRRTMSLIQGESLLNDASGLVCLRFAVAAALTGGFSLGDAALEFVWLAAGGIAAGLAVAWAIVIAKEWVGRHFGEDSGSQILISLLIPFLAYLAAERLGASGILAAVAAGIAMSFAETGGRAQPTTRLHRRTVWDALQFTANGIIFVLLGEQLPDILASAPRTVATVGQENPWWLAWWVLAISAGLLTLRFAWSWGYVRLTGLTVDGVLPTVRMNAVMALAGVRGAVTLAGVLTLPMTLGDGQPFPARDLAIFLATGAIIVSLLVASLALPLLLRGMPLPADHTHDAEEAAARRAAAEAALTEIDGMRHRLAHASGDGDLHVTIAARVMEPYRHFLDGDGRDLPASEKQRMAEIERQMRLAAIRAERGEIFRRVRSRQLGSETARRLIGELDLAEARYL
ncbi:MAG: Na+/H+ antiporter [Alphaproteobacteria bacterium]|jgi:CPA1 family monovalent cation:H+ antiporter|nr:Na+/H+ antiporter [Alphaproteobacteria bacterium]